MLLQRGLERNVRLFGRRVLPLVPFALLAAVVLVPAGLFMWLLFYTDVFTVQAITVVDAREHTLAATRDIIERNLARQSFGRSIFFVQTQSLEADIKAALPQVRTVHITRKLPGTVKAIVQEKTPALLLLSGGRYYFVDDKGVPYEEATLDRLPGIVLPTVKNDDQSGMVTLGAAAVSPEFVMFLQRVHEELPARIDSEVAEIHIPSLSAREVSVVLDRNWYVSFDITRSPEQQLDILRQLLTDTIDDDKQELLEYVDLRIPNRAYWRIKDS
jgi:cell division septal protein FtsQ